MGGHWQDYGASDTPPPFTYSIVLITCVVIELVRYQLHPDLYHVFRHPRVLIGCAVAATFAYHLWNVPGSLLKAAASAFFTQASMPTVMILSVKLVLAIGAAFRDWLGGLTKV